MILAFALFGGCTEETSIVIETNFHDSLHPNAMGEMVLVVEPLDGTGFDNLAEADTGVGGIRLRVVDVDQDTFPEMVFHVPADAVDFRSGGKLRLHRGKLPLDVPLRILGLAANYDLQQIGEGTVDETSTGQPLQFRDGAEVQAELTLACFCIGGRDCRPSEPGEEPATCDAEPATERFCGDLLQNDRGDLLADCADPDCFGLAGCEDCHAEDCTNDVDDNCDGVPVDGGNDCLDWQCQSADVCRGVRPEICVGGVDEDLDGAIDCFDLDCATQERCLTDCNPDAPEVCDNIRDDDCDGLIDCHDCDEQDCACPEEAWPTEELDCTNGYDEDCDGLPDCFDPDCLVAAACECPLGHEEICMDTFDSDCDGKTDCDDPDCLPFIQDERGALCSDGIDNNCSPDGRFDCQESTCLSDIGSLEEICGDTRDNDCDDLVDCRDELDCTGAGLAENCFDFIDNDCDNDADCDDPDCVIGPESCWNFRDDDCDGDWDCSDSECEDVAVCEGFIPEICGNAADDDGDEWVDCTDEDCLASPSCT